MKPMLILAAALTLAAAAPARADQTLRFNIVGAGRIVGQGLDCTRSAPGAGQTGDCDEFVVDGPPNCDELFCLPNPGSLQFQAVDINGFHFVRWSHPQCPNGRNPCTVLVALGSGLPDLTVTATFADVQAPTATLIAPANGSTVRGVIPLSAVATDNSGSVANVVFRVAGNPFQIFEVPPFTTTLDTRTRPDGPLAISATATDGAGLINVSAAIVTVDNTNPTLTLTGPADGAVFRVGQRADWTIAASDATSGLTVRCSVVTQGQPPVFGACTSATSESLANPRAGRFTLTVRATDGAGNAAEQTRSFTVGGGPVPCVLNGRPIICP